MREMLDVIYSKEYGEYRALDLFFPEKEPNGKCILFIHGGGWSGGGRTKWHEVARFFAGRGYVCASASYRLAPQFTFPAPIEDLRLAMQFLKTNAGQYGFDAQSIATFGSSAGGHLSAMLGTIHQTDRTGAVPELVMPDTRPSACICYCPITFVQLWEPHAESIPDMLGSFMGTTEDLSPGLYHEASPADRITGDEPPYLFVHGDVDALIPISHSRVMCERLVKQGSVAELLVLEGAPHGFGYGTKNAHQQQAHEKVGTFLEKHLKGFAVVSPA